MNKNLQPPVPADASPDRSALELRAVLDASVDAVVMIDHDGRIETFNRSAELLFGYRADEVIGRNVSLLMPEPYRSDHDRHMRNYQQTGSAKIIGIGREVVAQRRDGTVFPAALAVGEVAGARPARFVGFIKDITARKVAVDALRRERDRAQLYLDRAEVMLLAIDATGRISLINRKGGEILGYSESELVGRDWFELCIPERQRAAGRAALQAALSGDGRQPGPAEARVVARDGQLKLIAWRGTPVRDELGHAAGLLVSGEDITERRLAERALQKSESLLKAAQSIARLGNYEVRLPAGTAHWSEQMYQIAGRDPGEGPVLPADFAQQFVHADDRERFGREWQRAVHETGRFDLEYRLVRRDGTTRHVHALADVQAGAGSLLITGTLHDITERKLADEEARQAQERLTHVGRLSIMGEMATGLAHEINQPLTAIATYAQAALRMMAAGVPAAELKDPLTQITNQALRAGEVIRRLRTFVKNRAAHTEPVDLNRLIEELRVLAEPDVRVNDVRLTLELAAVVPAVAADPVQVQQVLLNLIRNAIDATLEAPAAPREIVVRTGVTLAEVEVAVIDRAGGVDPAIGALLFNPFFTTKPSGTGLGLAISRSIIRAHRGKLGYRPTPGGGTTFYFTLPPLPGG